MLSGTAPTFFAAVRRFGALLEDFDDAAFFFTAGLIAFFFLTGVFCTAAFADED